MSMNPTPAGGPVPADSVYERYRLLVRRHSANKNRTAVVALMDFTRAGGFSRVRLRQHQSHLIAWLGEMVRLGEQTHSDSLVAMIASGEELLEEPPAAATLETLAVSLAGRVPKLHPGDSAVHWIASELLLGCPCRERRHWEDALALAGRVDMIAPGVSLSRATTATVTAYQDLSCSGCGRPGVVFHRVHARDGRLHFSSSFRCDQCGSAVESDDTSVPETLRSFFVVQDGEWELWLADLGAQKFPALQKLRQLLGLSPVQAATLTSGLPRAIAKGLRAEMEAFAQQLPTAAGLVVEVVRAGSRGPLPAPRS